MTGILASVRSLAEAEIVTASGVDIVDLKDPSTGVLGALPTETIAAIAGKYGHANTISATIGDMIMHPVTLEERITAVAGTGVDYVKVGIFTNLPDSNCLRALASCTAAGVAIVTVFFADNSKTEIRFDELAAAGIRGVMLDTRNKTNGSLRAYMSDKQLADFIAGARANSLLSGLAGALKTTDIEPLLGLCPDYLGFRGALCHNGNRDVDLDREKIEEIKKLYRLYNGGTDFAEVKYGTVA